MLRRKCKLEFRGVHSEQHCHSRTVVQWCGNLPDEWYHGTMCIKSCPCTGERNAIVPLSHSTVRFYQRHSLRSHASVCAQKGFVLLVPEGHCLQRRRSGITFPDGNNRPRRVLSSGDEEKPAPWFAARRAAVSFPDMRKRPLPFGSGRGESELCGPQLGFDRKGADRDTPCPLFRFYLQSFLNSSATN